MQRPRCPEMGPRATASTREGKHNELPSLCALGSLSLGFPVTFGGELKVLKVSTTSVTSGHPDCTWPRSRLLAWQKSIHPHGGLKPGLHFLLPAGKVSQQESQLLAPPAATPGAEVTVEAKSAFSPRGCGSHRLCCPAPRALSPAHLALGLLSQTTHATSSRPQAE